MQPRRRFGIPGLPAFEAGERVRLTRRLGCETASNRDPLPKQDNALITDAEFDRRGVPIGADRNPGKPYISRATSMPLL